MKKIIFILSIALIQACAFTDATLDVRHNPDSELKGPISDVNSIEFVLTELKDNREDTARIGWKKNGYGQNTADIFTTQNVGKIVSDGIANGLTKNSHKVGESGNIRIEGSVNRFWFEMDPNMWTVEFTGDIQCTLNFVDTTSNQSIYKSDYSGSFSKKTGGGLEKTWTEVMSQAVDKLIEDIIFDEDLAEALDE